VTKSVLQSLLARTLRTLLVYNPRHQVGQMSATCKDVAHEKPHASGWVEKIVAVHDIAKRYNEVFPNTESKIINPKLALHQLCEMYEELQSILQQPRCTAMADPDMERALSNLFTKDFQNFSDKISLSISKLRAERVGSI
jgi:hypothetical protein